MNIPTIGGARGIFEIFVPGLFLFVNIVAFLSLAPFSDLRARELAVGLLNNTGLALIFAVCFGYLIGIILRLMRARIPDRASGGVRRLASFVRRSKAEPARFNEPFPYIGWLGDECIPALPPEARAFYDLVWKPRQKNRPGNEFFNFCKTMIASADQDAAREVYAAEALVRYVAGMFYALGLSSGLMTALIIVDVLATGAIALWLILILAGYLSALCAIAWYYRAIRCKEVFTVFAASFRNYSAFLDRDRQHVLMSLAEEARQASVEGDQAGSGDG